ncbi:unnamed protein product [Amoebophrya sp. A120]|nr:unnamed protein product [Amoebophrya sp. A120]|eukprot:GSA120T00016819001.1
MWLIAIEVEPPTSLVLLKWGRGVKTLRYQNEKFSENANLPLLVGSRDLHVMVWSGFDRACNNINEQSMLWHENVAYDLQKRGKWVTLPLPKGGRGGSKNTGIEDQFSIENAIQVRLRFAQAPPPGYDPHVEKAIAATRSTSAAGPLSTQHVLAADIENPASRTPASAIPLITCAQADYEQSNPDGFLLASPLRLADGIHARSKATTTSGGEDEDFSSDYYEAANEQYLMKQKSTTTTGATSNHAATTSVVTSKTRRLYEESKKPSAIANQLAAIANREKYSSRSPSPTKRRRELLASVKDVVDKKLDALGAGGGTIITTGGAAASSRPGTTRSRHQITGGGSLLSSSNGADEEFHEERRTMRPAASSSTTRRPQSAKVVSAGAAPARAGERELYDGSKLPVAARSRAGPGGPSFATTTRRPQTANARGRASASTSSRAPRAPSAFESSKATSFDDDQNYSFENSHHTSTSRQFTQHLYSKSKQSTTSKDTTLFYTSVGEIDELIQESDEVLNREELVREHEWLLSIHDDNVKILTELEKRVQDLERKKRREEENRGKSPPRRDEVRERSGSGGGTTTGARKGTTAGTGTSSARGAAHSTIKPITTPRSAAGVSRPVLGRKVVDTSMGGCASAWAETLPFQHNPRGKKASMVVQADFAGGSGDAAGAGGSSARTTIDFRKTRTTPGRPQSAASFNQMLGPPAHPHDNYYMEPGVAGKTVARCSALVERARKMERKNQLLKEVEEEKKREIRRRKELLGHALTEEEKLSSASETVEEYLPALYEATVEQTQLFLQEEKRNKAQKKRRKKEGPMGVESKSVNSSKHQTGGTRNSPLDEDHVEETSGGSSDAKNSRPLSPSERAKTQLAPLGAKTPRPASPTRTSDEWGQGALSWMLKSTRAGDTINEYKGVDASQSSEIIGEKSEDGVQPKWVDVEMTTRRTSKSSVEVLTHKSNSKDSVRSEIHRAGTTTTFSRPGSAQLAPMGNSRSSTSGQARPKSVSSSSRATTAVANKFGVTTSSSNPTTVTKELQSRGARAASIGKVSAKQPLSARREQLQVTSERKPLPRTNAEVWAELRSCWAHLSKSTNESKGTVVSAGNNAESGSNEAGEESVIAAGENEKIATATRDDEALSVAADPAAADPTATTAQTAREGGTTSKEFEKDWSDSQLYLTVEQQLPLIRLKLRERYHVPLTAFRAFDLDTDNVLCFEEFAYGFHVKCGCSEEFVDSVWEEITTETSGQFCRFVDFSKKFFPKASFAAVRNNRSAAARTGVASGAGETAGGTAASFGAGSSPVPPVVHLYQVRTLVPLRLREKPKVASKELMVLEEGKTYDVFAVLGEWVNIRTWCTVVLTDEGQLEVDEEEEGRGTGAGGLRTTSAGSSSLFNITNASSTPSSQKVVRTKEIPVDGWALRRQGPMNFVERIYAS